MDRKTIALRMDYEKLTAYEKLNFLAKEKVEERHLVNYKKGKTYGSYLNGGDISAKGRLVFEI